MIHPLSKYKPEYCSEIIQLAASGRSMVQIAATWGVAYDTVYGWSKDLKKPEFMEAYKIARTVNEGYHEDVLQKIAKGILKGASAAAQIYLMKARFKGDWLESTTQKIELKNEVKSMTNQEIDDTIKALLAQRSLNKDKTPDEHSGMSPGCV